jgi:GT2 family glycosyltransferase
VTHHATDGEHLAGTDVRPGVRPGGSPHASNGGRRPGGLVPHNRWDLIEVDELDRFVPQLRVSVVVPHYQAVSQLWTTLHALREQSYPQELVEVLVVDDGSDPPLELPGAIEGLSVRVIHQPRQGFGLARARNRGAAASSGDILVFLDCDMVPVRSAIAAHARWHHACHYAATIGFRQHVEMDDLDAATIGAAVRADRLEQLFSGRPQDHPAWIEDHMVRFDELRAANDDVFRVVTGGNLGIRRELFQRTGGFDETFDRWGGEDTEFGYRAFVAGALLVPERAAACWHQGEGHVPSESELRSLEDQRAKMAHLVAHRGFRSTARGRSYAVPRVGVSVEASDQSRGLVAATVESILGSELHDLLVHVRVPADHPDGLWLERQFVPDPRVVATATEVPWQTPYRVVVPAGVVVEPTAIGALVRVLQDPAEPVGVLDVTVAGRRPREASLRIWSSRAEARAAQQHPDAAAARMELAAALFGRRWLSGLDIGVSWVDAVTQMAEEANRSRSTDEMQAQGLELWNLVATLDDAQRQQVIGTARTVLARFSPGQLAFLLRFASRLMAVFSALGALVGSRDPRSARIAVGRLVNAILPERLVISLRRLRDRVLGPPPPIDD